MSPSSRIILKDRYAIEPVTLIMFIQQEFECILNRGLPTCSEDGSSGERNSVCGLTCRAFNILLTRSNVRIHEIQGLGKIDMIWFVGAVMMLAVRRSGPRITAIQANLVTVRV